jgi:hypothetical protein
MSGTPFPATISAMNIYAGPLSRLARVRQGIRRVFARATRRVSQAHPLRARGEGGAVLIEFAIILPILVTLTFGIVEYAGAYHDSAIAADAVRAGGRVGSALGTNTSYTTSIVNAVNSAFTTLPSDAPKELWIYKANAQGYPGSGTSFSSCSTNCIKYAWDSATESFNMSAPQGGGWPAATHQVCTEPFDELGVFVKINHKFVTGLFGANITMDDHSVFRFEPVPTSACAS